MGAMSSLGSTYCCHARPGAERDRAGRAHGLALPASPALGEQERRAVAVEAALDPYVPRVTMTPKVFGETAVLVYLVTGEAKAPAVKAAFADEPSPATPASGIRGRTTIAILDAAAASLLLRDSGAARGRRDEPAQPVPVACDEPVGSAARAPDRAVAPDDMSALEANRLRQARQQWLGGGDRRRAGNASRPKSRRATTRAAKRQKRQPPS